MQPAVVLVHNHPAGLAEPSRADQALTDRLREALALVEARVLDHIVIGDGETVSFSERGMVFAVSQAGTLLILIRCELSTTATAERLQEIKQVWIVVVKACDLGR